MFPRNAAMDMKIVRAERKISSPSTPLINSGEQNTSTVGFLIFFIFGEIRQCHIVPLRHNDLQVSVLYECYVLIWVKVDTVSICHLPSQLFA